MRLRSLGDNLQTEYTYNAWSQQGGRLSWLKSGTTGSPEALQKLEYGYDAGGNLTSIRDYLAASPYEEQVYGYDALNRLTGVSGGLSESYTYDANTGNLASKTGMGSYGYNDTAHKHAVTHLDGTLKFTYDANGNMTQRVVGGHTYILIYDAENRLVEVKKDSVTIATFVYDADGRRIKGVVAGTTSYYYFAHYEVVNGIVRKYYALGGQAVAMRSAGTLTYLFSDHLGSTTVTADINGVRVAELRYKPWGETRYTDGATPTARHYTGQYEESAFDLYFYNARWYDPALGRFVQADTIVPQPGSPLAFDRYMYAQNNPVNFTDPSGHCTGDPSDPENPDIECWNMINKIENTYSNIKVHNKDRWLLNELLNIWKALLSHVFIAQILQSGSINFFRENFYQSPIDGIGGKTLYDDIKNSFNITIFDFAYQILPDVSGKGQKSDLNFEGVVIHELSHVAIKNNPFIVESYNLILWRGPRSYGGSYNFSNCLKVNCQSEEEIAMAATVLQISPASFTFYFLGIIPYTDQRKNWIELFYSPNPLAYREYGPMYFSAAK